MVAVASFSQVANASIFVGSISVGSKSYSFYKYDGNDDKDWNLANAFANSLSTTLVNAHLATITSFAEDELIDFGRTSLGLGQLWVGGFQNGMNGPGDDWTWVNGEGTFPGDNLGPVYANWLGGEPNDAYGANSEEYLAIGLGNQFGWNDEGNLGGIEGFVVEFTTNAIPEPNSLAIWGLAGVAGMFARRRARS
jgi:hypothetical protein